MIPVISSRAEAAAQALLPVPSFAAGVPPPPPLPGAQNYAARPITPIATTVIPDTQSDLDNDMPDPFDRKVKAPMALFDPEAKQKGAKQHKRDNPSILQPGAAASSGAGIGVSESPVMSSTGSLAGYPAGQDNPRSRSRTPEPLPPAGADTPIDQATLLADSLAAVRAKDAEKQKTELKVFLENSHGQIHAQIQKQYDEAVSVCLGSVNKRIDNVESSVGDLATKVAALTIGQSEGQASTDAKLIELTNTMKSMQESFDKASQHHGMSASASLPALSPSGAASSGNDSSQPLHIPVVAMNQSNAIFNRTPDPKKIYVNIHSKASVPVQNFRDAFQALATDVNIAADQYKIVGDPLDDRFEVIFTGDPHSAMVACAQFLASLILGKGKRKAQNVVDNNGQSHQFYCNPDKNPAQVRREILCKNLKEIVDPVITAKGKQAFMRKTTGSVMVDRKVLGTVIIGANRVARIEWYKPTVISLGIDTIPFDQTFSAISDGGQRP